MERGQTDAARLAGGGELGLLVRSHDDCSREPGLQLVASAFQVGDFLAERSDFLLLRGIKGAENAVRLTVERLPRHASPCGMTGDITLIAEEHNGGASQVTDGP
jgi:hypothetical protein